MKDAKPKAEPNSSRSNETPAKEWVPIRPRVVESPEKFNTLVDEYFQLCIDVKAPPTLTGMILALGLTSKEGFYHYAKYEGFEDAVSRARLMIEHEYEKRLVGGNFVASIFALKNFGWFDKQSTELDRLQVEKLKRELAGGSDSVAQQLALLADKLPG
jgi:hypothetical protein